MHYLCLVFHEAATPPDDARSAEALACSEELRRQGRALLAASLGPAAGAARVSVRGDRAGVGAVPARLARERPCELYVLCAADLNAAISLAARLPAARRGRVELWPLEIHGGA